MCAVATTNTRGSTFLCRAYHHAASAPLPAACTACHARCACLPSFGRHHSNTHPTPPTTHYTLPLPHRTGTPPYTRARVAFQHGAGPPSPAGLWRAACNLAQERTRNCLRANIRLARASTCSALPYISPTARSLHVAPRTTPPAAAAAHCLLRRSLAPGMGLRLHAAILPALRQHSSSWLHMR